VAAAPSPAPGGGGGGQEGEFRHFHNLSLYFFFFFFTLVTGPRRSVSLKLRDTRVYAPQIRARLGTTAHFCNTSPLQEVATAPSPAPEESPEEGEGGEQGEFALPEMDAPRRLTLVSPRILQIAVERTRHSQDSQAHILALAFRQ